MDARQMHKMKHHHEDHKKKSDSQQVIPLVPLYLTNALFFVLFFSVAYFLLTRWREKIRTSTPLNVVSSSETAAIVSLLASFIYLIGFFGIGFIHPRDDELSHDDDDDDDDESYLKKTLAARSRQSLPQLPQSQFPKKMRRLCRP